MLYCDVKEENIKNLTPHKTYIREKNYASSTYIVYTLFNRQTLYFKSLSAGTVYSRCNKTHPISRTNRIIAQTSRKVNTFLIKS